MNPLESLAVELVANVKGFVTDANKAIDNVEKNAEKSFKNVEKNATGTFGKVGKAIMGALGGAVLGGAIGTLGSMFAKLDQTMAGVSARAGLTEKQTDQLTKSVIKLSKANLQSQDEIAGTAEALISLQGIEADNQEQIERLTSKYLDYAKVTGQTAPDAVAAFDDILDAWNLTAEDGIGIMDALILSHQKFGTDVVGAQGALNKYASTFQTLGLDVNDAIGYINLFAASGVDAESSAAAFNKAVGLLTDNTDASNKKLAQMATNLGLTVDELDAFNAADPAGKFDILTKAIAATEDPTLRAQAAIDLFGSKAGPKLAEALAGNGIEDFKIDMAEAAGATDLAADKIDKSMINKLKLLGNEIKGRAMEITQQFAPALMLIGTVGPQAVAGVAGLAGAFLPLLANPMGLALAAIVLGLVALELKTHFLSVTVLPELKTAFADVSSVLTDLWASALREVTDYLTNDFLPAAADFATAVGTTAYDAAKKFADFTKDELLPPLKDVANVITNVLQPAIEKVTGVVKDNAVPSFNAFGISLGVIVASAAGADLAINIVGNSIGALGGIIMSVAVLPAFALWVIPLAAVIAALVVLEMRTHFLSEEVLPILQEIGRYLEAEWLPVLKDAADIIWGELVPAWAQLKQLFDGLAPVLVAAFEQLMQAIKPLIPIVQELTKFVAEHKEVQIALAVVVVALALALFGIPLAMQAVIAGGVLLLAHWDEIRDAIDEQINKFQELIEKISEIPIIGEIVQAAFDTVVAIVTAAFATIIAVIDTQIDIITGIFKIAWALIHGDFGKAWDEIKSLIGEVFEDIKGIFSIQLGLIRDLIWIAVQGFAGVISDGAILLLEAGTKLMQALYDGVVTAGVDLLTYFINLPERIIGELGDLGTKLYNYAYDAVGEMAKGVTAAIDKVLGAFGKLAGKLNPFSSPPGFHELPGQYNAFGKSLTQSITDGIHGGLAQVSGAMGKVADALGRSGGQGDGGWAGIGKRIGEAVQKGFSTGNTDGGWAGVGQAAGAAIAGGMQGAIGGIAKVVGEGMQGVAGVIAGGMQGAIAKSVGEGAHWEWFKNQLADAMDGITATLQDKASNSADVLTWFDNQFKDAFDNIAADLTDKVPDIMSRMGWFDGQMKDAFDGLAADILVGGVAATAHLDWFTNQVTDAFDGLIDSATDPAIIVAFKSLRDELIAQWTGMAKDASGVQDALDHVAVGAGSMHDALLLANAGFVDMANGIVQLNLGLISSADLIAIYNGEVATTVDAVARALANYDLLASAVEMAHDKTLTMHEAQLLAQAGFEGLGIAIRDYNLGLIDADELTRQVEATFTEVATSAAVLGAQWTTAFADAMGREDLLEAVGSAGVRILDQLNTVLTVGGQKNVEALAGMVASMLTELESTLPADEAAVLGETITDALQEAIEKGTPEAIQAVVDLLDGANEAMHNGTTKILTSVDKFNVLLGNKVADKALQAKIGKNGADLMGALNTAIETGGAKGVETMAQEAFDIIGAMGNALEPGAADYLGGQLMSALQTALETGGADAVAAVMAILAQINTLIAGAPTTIPAPTLAGAPATSPKGSGGSPSDDGAHGSTPTPTKAPRKTRQNKIDDIIKRLTGFDPSAARQAVLDMFNAIYTGQTSKKFADDVGYNAGINWADFKNYLRSLGHVSFDQGGLLMPGFTPVWNGTGVPEQVIAPGAGGNSTRSTNYGKQYFIYGPGRQSKDVIRDLDKLLA